VQAAVEAPAAAIIFNAALRLTSSLNGHLAWLQDG